MRVVSNLNVINLYYFAETKRRCGFFLDVFGLELPEYLDCEMFPESENPDTCVGHHEVKEAEKRALKPGLQRFRLFIFV